jgi:hypothetical protein
MQKSTPLLLCAHEEKNCGMRPSDALIDNLNHLARVVEINPNGRKNKTIQHKKIDNFLQKFDNTLIKLNSVIPDFPPNCLITASSVTGENGIQFFLFFIRTLILQIINQAEEIDKLILAENQLLSEELKEMKELLNQENSSAVCSECSEDNDPTSPPQVILSFELILLILSRLQLILVT